ncbi:MAG TPA: DUF4233 domain-containing protein [Pseudolysinimonas sp.]|nr:DUF4233 domain-containing protein [Pseudolysinimonas sp.]
MSDTRPGPDDITAPDAATAPPGRIRRPRRQRSLTETLLSIVLVLEAVLIFFVALTAFGLDVLAPALPNWSALAFGGGFIVLLMIVSRLQRYRWGVGIGWVIQLALIALGILLPAMYVVGAGFLALWIFCFVRGRAIDRAKLAYLNRIEGDAA